MDLPAYLLQPWGGWWGAPCVFKGETIDLAQRKDGTPRDNLLLRISHNSSMLVSIFLLGDGIFVDMIPSKIRTRNRVSSELAGKLTGLVNYLLANPRVNGNVVFLIPWFSTDDFAEKIGGW